MAASTSGLRVGLDAGALLSALPPAAVCLVPKRRPGGSSSPQGPAPIHDLCDPLRRPGGSSDTASGTRSTTCGGSSPSTVHTPPGHPRGSHSSSKEAEWRASPARTSLATNKYGSLSLRDCGKVRSLVCIRACEQPDALSPAHIDECWVLGYFSTLMSAIITAAIERAGFINRLLSTKRVLVFRLAPVSGVMVSSSS